MKFFASLAILPVLASALTTSYDPTYDNKAGSLATVACSDGENGLLTAGFKTFGSLPKFPFIGGAPAVASWNSVNCGTCWNLTYVNTKNVSKTISVLAIDVSGPNFNIAKSAMDTLTGGQATQLGRVTITAKEVASSVCGL